MENDEYMVEHFLPNKISSILVSFVTDPFLYTVSHPFAKKYSKFHGQKLDIFIPCTHQEAAQFKESGLFSEYETRWHNSYYFRAQSTAMLLTNILNHHFILKNNEDFLELFCTIPHSPFYSFL